MSLANYKDKVNSLLATAGRAALHSNYPNDFEYYSIAFELINGAGETVDLLVMPILPSSLSISEQPNTSVKRSGGGIAVLFNTSFQPFNISLNGNFGRKFRFLVGRSDISGVGFRFNFKGTEFDTQIKSGYGVTKVLEGILKNSLVTDKNNQPHILIFHNMAFNQSHVVEYKSGSFTQNDSNSNMIWNYSISLQAVMPSAFLNKENRTSLKSLTKYSILQKATNAALSVGVEALWQAKNKLRNGF